MLADELRAMREQAAQRERDNADRERQQADERRRSALQSWMFGEDAPVWSNWVLAAIAFFAGWVAVRAFDHEREAVRLTQRADVLVSAMGFDPNPRQTVLPSGTTVYAMPTHGEVVVTFQNFGTTRADKVRWDLALLVEGRSPVVSENPSRHAQVVIAAGSQIAPTTGPVSAYFDAATLEAISRGDMTMKVKATVDYVDVFRTAHTTVQFGTYTNGRFVVDENTEAN